MQSKNTFDLKIDKKDLNLNNNPPKIPIPIRCTNYLGSFFSSIYDMTTPLFQLFIRGLFVYIFYRIIFHKQVSINLPKEIVFNLSSSKINVLNYGYIIILIIAIIFFGKQLKSLYEKILNKLG